MNCPGNSNQYDRQETVSEMKKNKQNLILRACPNIIQIVKIVNRNQFVFESVLDVVSKQNQNVKREMQPKNMGELQPTGRSKLCTHADNLALGNTDPPEQQAYTTTFRPWEVVGPPMEVVACPTLTHRDQTLSYTENELPASCSRASC